MVQAIDDKEEVASKVWIPEVSKEDIEKLAERIKPIVRFAKLQPGLFRSRDGFPYYIEQVDLFDTAYTWDPIPTEEVGSLKEICDITTYHTYGYHGFFKPSVAEVLAQIPKEHLGNVIAFEIVRPPEHVDDLNREKEALNAGYHVAVTRLYGRE